MIPSRHPSLRGAARRDDADRYQQLRQREHDVGASREDRVAPAAEEAGEQADDEADQDGDAGGDERRRAATCARRTSCARRGRGRSPSAPNQKSLFGPCGMPNSSSIVSVYAVVFGWPVTFDAIGPPKIARKMRMHDHDPARERDLVLAEPRPEQLPGALRLATCVPPAGLSSSAGVVTSVVVVIPHSLATCGWGRTRGRKYRTLFPRGCLRAKRRAIA